MSFVLVLTSRAFRVFISFLGTTAIAFAIVLVLLGCYYWKYRRSFSKFPSFSFEPPLFLKWITRNVPEDYTRYLYYWIIDICKSHRDEGLLLLWGIKPILMLFDPQYVKVIANDPALIDKPYLYRLFTDMAGGNGILTVNGSLWRERRKLLHPAFRFDVLKCHVPTFNRGAEIVVKQLTEISNKPTDEVTHILKTGSLRILCESILGLKMVDEKYDAKLERYLELLSYLADYTLFRLCRPWLYWRSPQLLFESGRKHRTIYQEFQNFTKNMLLEIKKSMPPNSTSNNNKEGYANASFNNQSLAHMLFEYHIKNPDFTLEDLHADLTTFIFAGHDTTAYTLTWCLFMLGVHPDVQDKAHEEVVNVIGTKNTFSYSDLNSLTYLECVIKETLRLYPTVPFFGRVTTKDIKLGKYDVPKNTVIAFMPHLLHRDPKIFPDPETFDPQRFQDKVKQPWAYVPFSEGVRSCIGKKFALLQIKTIIAHILKNFVIKSLDKKEDVQVDWKLVTTPFQPIRFHLTRRQ